MAEQNPIMQSIEALKALVDAEKAKGGPKAEALVAAFTQLLKALSMPSEAAQPAPAPAPQAEPAPQPAPAQAPVGAPRPMGQFNTAGRPASRVM